MDRRTPVRIAAWNAISSALQSGRLQKPDKCERCKELEKFAANGTSLLHAHHDDYTRPLDIRWLCNRCHIRAHRGDDCLSNVVTPDMVAEIKAIRMHKGLSYPMLSQMYGISLSRVRDIVCGYRWQDIPPAVELPGAVAELPVRAYTKRRPSVRTAPREVEWPVCHRANKGDRNCKVCNRYIKNTNQECRPRRRSNQHLVKRYS